MAVSVVPAAEAREHLTAHLRGVREQSEAAPPVVVGPHRKAEAVPPSVEQYRAMGERIQERSLGAEVIGELLERV